MGLGWKWAALAPMVLLGSCLSYYTPGSIAVTQRNVEVGGYSMHLIDKGVGPTVVFSGGSGTNDPFFDLEKVIVPTSAFARTVTYERAGYGKSTASAAPRTVDTRVDDLAWALDQISAPAPYILVGHSYASLELIRFAQRYPERVRGIVLIDGVPPKFYRTYSPDNTWSSSIFGLFFPQAPGMAPEKLVLKSDAEAVIAGGSVGKVPLIALQAGANGIPDWAEFQQEFLGYSDQASTVIVPGADHFIQNSNPDRIVESIRSLCLAP